MAKNNETIKNEIENFKSTHEGDYEDYYIGITRHVDQRLIESSGFVLEHLQKGEYTLGNPTYSEECEGRNNAVEIEHYFQMKGMLKYNYRSVGVKDSKFIYCYKMTEENKKTILLENSEAAKKVRKQIKKFREFETGNKH